MTTPHTIRLDNAPFLLQINASNSRLGRDGLHIKAYNTFTTKLFNTGVFCIKTKTIEVDRI